MWCDVLFIVLQIDKPKFFNFYRKWNCQIKLRVLYGFRNKLITILHINSINSQNNGKESHVDKSSRRVSVGLRHKLLWTTNSLLIFKAYNIFPLHYPNNEEKKNCLDSNWRLEYSVLSILVCFYDPKCVCCYTCQQLHFEHRVSGKISCIEESGSNGVYLYPLVFQTIRTF